MDNEVEKEETTQPTPETTQETPATENTETTATPEPETYTKDQVSAIVQERLKGWQKFGKPEDIEQRLSKAAQLEQFYADLQAKFKPGEGLPNQAPQVAPETEEDKKVRAYMEKLYPGLSKWQDQQRDMQQHISQLHQHRWQAVTEQNTAKLKDWSAKAGYKEEQFASLNEHVANSIRGNPKDHAEYIQTGNPEIVKRHFDAVDKWVKSFQAVPAVAKAADYAKTKAKTAALPPKLPPGGVAAPTAKKGKLSDSERIGAAFEALQKG